jgi:hypothetical protein
MLRHIGRFLATACIWVVSFGVTVGVIEFVTHGMNVIGAAIIVVLALTLAFLITLSLRHERTPITDDEKRKRTTFSESPNKTDMLLALMDDDEREAFKEALKQRMLDSVSRLSDDGESPVAFDDLLRTDDSKRGNHFM